MKILFSPAGIIAMLVLAFILFFPRRLPNLGKKLHKPMRAFPDEPEKDESRTEK